MAACCQIYLLLPPHCAFDLLRDMHCPTEAAMACFHLTEGLMSLKLFKLKEIQSFGAFFVVTATRFMNTGH